ncbi:hypothetical protein Tco_0415733 [Tanacetum coccineum]
MKLPIYNYVPSPQVSTFISTVQQTPTPILTPLITIDAPTIINVVYEFDALSAVELRVAKLEKDVSELKTVDHSSKALDVLQSQVPTVVDSYLDTKVRDVFQKELQKYMANLIHKNSLNLANHRLYHALLEALTEDENAIDKGVADIVKDHKRKNDDDEDDDDEDPPARPNQDKLDWNNPEGYRYPFDLSKPLPLQGPLGHRTLPLRYFLQQCSIKHAYDKDAEKGIKHWGERRKLWYQSQHGIWSLKEIWVKRSDQQLYKFKEGDFVDLHLNDIEDMLFLAVQHKLFHLNRNVIVDFIVALRVCSQES